MDFISITRIWEQLLFNIRWLIYYLWWSIANRNSHFSFLHHMSEANASYLEWNGKCFIAEWNGAASSSGVFYEAFCGDAAKYEAHLAMHEAALRAMKQSLTASFRHFFLLFKNALMGLPSFHSGYPAFLQKKMAAGFFSLPHHSKTLF